MTLGLEYRRVPESEQSVGRIVVVVVEHTQIIPPAEIRVPASELLRVDRLLRPTKVEWSKDETSRAKVESKQKLC